MDLTRTCLWAPGYKLYENRFWRTLAIAIGFHIVLIWWLSQQPHIAMPELPDWVEVKLVAGLETAEQVTADKSQQATPQPRPTKNKPAAKANQPEKVTTPSAPSQAKDSIQTRQQPKVLDNPKPVYPAAAKRRGMQGTVLLQLEVSARGKVTAVELKKSSGYRVLDVAAMNGVKEWQFIPAQDEDEKRISFVEIPIRFELQNL